MSSSTTFSSIPAEIVIRMKEFGHSRYGIVFDPPEGPSGTATAQTPLGECVIEFVHDGVQTDSTAQLAYLLAHPFAVPTIALDTLRAHAIEYAIMFVGALGSLDVLLPKLYYVVAGLILAAALIADLTGPPATSAGARGLLLLVLLVAAALIFASQYLIWTAVGATVIEGVQGRYFLPLLPAAALLIGGLLPPAPRLRATAWTLVAGFPLVTAMVVPVAVWARYYG